jgi:hypothetical protein
LNALLQGYKWLCPKLFKSIHLRADEMNYPLYIYYCEQLHNLYASQNIIRVIRARRRWAGHVVRMGEMRNTYNILIGKPEERKPLGRHRSRWKDNISLSDD